MYCIVINKIGKGRFFFKKFKNQIYFIYKIYAISPFFLKKLYTFLFRGNKFKILFNYFDLKQNSKFVGDNVYISQNVIIKNQSNLSVGSNFSIHEFSYIDAAGDIEIGDNVSIAHNCSLISFEHGWDDIDTPIKYNPTKLHKIKIGNDVWLGCGVRILSGTVIEDRVIVAAGAVVKGHLESGYIYGGVPARRLKKL